MKRAGCGSNWEEAEMNRVRRMLRLSCSVLFLTTMCAGGCSGGDGIDTPEFKYLDIHGGDQPGDTASDMGRLETLPVDIRAVPELPWDLPLVDEKGDAETLDASELAAADQSTDTIPREDTAPDVSPAEEVDSEEDVAEEPPPLFDHEMIRDATTAACSFTDHHVTLKDGVLVDAWKVSYYSWESIDGELVPILIRGFASRPAGSGTGLPGVVHAHGLGGYAKKEHATGTAALLGMFVLAYTGPGGGTEPDNTSEGLSADHESGYRMFDTLEDLRGSWFWAHEVAALRGLTCLENHPDVDPERLGITGVSAGGVVSSIAAGVDDRVKVSVPLSGTLAWGVATQSPDAWQHNLLSAAGLDIESQEWLLLLELVDPVGILGNTEAKVMMVNGSSDEFFPLTAHMACFEAIAGSGKRTSIAANFDHGCYALMGVESEKTIADRASLRASGGQRMWFRHWFDADDNYEYVPQPPVVEVLPVGPATMVTAVVDAGGGKLEVEEVKVWWSNDDAFLFFSADLKEQGNNVYSELTLFPHQANSIYYVDVQYKTKALIFAERFSISSPPVIPGGLIPHIRSMATCL